MEASEASAASAARVRTAVLTARRSAGAGLTLITLTPSSEDCVTAYHSPGQYIEVIAEHHEQEERGFFALASESQAPSWEILVRNVGGVADVLSNAAEGTTFTIVGPLGSGFPLAHAASRELVVAVVGSAMAVTRPIIRERMRMQNAKATTTTIYLGVRTAEDVPLVDEVLGWMRAGVKLVLCLSQPHLDDHAILPDATRRTGYVQNVLASDVSEGRVKVGLVFAAGPLDMLAEVRLLPEKAARNGEMLEVITNV